MNKIITIILMFLVQVGASHLVGVGSVKNISIVVVN